MKKNRILSILLISLFFFILTGCVEISNRKSKEETNKQENIVEVFEIYTENTEDLENIISKDVEKITSSLESEYNKLEEKIKTYNDYVNNVKDVEKFYTKIVKETKNLNARLKRYSINYAEMIINSEKDNNEKYDDIDILYDVIYDGALEDIYDEIYDGLLEDMYDDFYDGIIDEAYDNVKYSEWSNISSSEYEIWSNASSDVYESWSDTSSDIYELWSELSNDLYDDDIEKAKEEIKKFKEDINKID